MEISRNLTDAPGKFLYISVCIAHAVQCSSFNALAGWHSDERWLELIITCSFTDISKFMSGPYAAVHLILCGYHISAHVIVMLNMIDRRKNLLEFG